MHERENKAVMSLLSSQMRHLFQKGTVVEKLPGFEKCHSMYTNMFRGKSSNKKKVKVSNVPIIRTQRF